jgi:hypothetical protein
MKKVNVYTISVTKNEYEENIKSSVFLKTISMFISYKQYNNYTANDVRLQEITHVGITADKTLEKGMVIDNQYTVEFINNDGKDSIVFLKQVV